MSTDPLQLRADLAAQQAALVAQIQANADRVGAFAGARDPGLTVYRRNLLGVARSALAITFPSIHGFLETSDFQALSLELLLQHPPTQGDWAQWGATFPALIRDSGLGRQFGFLAPLAELDWHSHHSARAADTNFDRDSLHYLAEAGLDNTGIELAPHLSLLNSHYPLLEIRRWHRGQQSDQDSFVVTKACRTIISYRPQFNVEHYYISSGEQFFLNGLQARRAIGELLDALAPEPFDFSHWLQQALQRNLIQRFYLL